MNQPEGHTLAERVRTEKRTSVLATPFSCLSIQNSDEKKPIRPGFRHLSASIASIDIIRAFE